MSNNCSNEDCSNSAIAKVIDRSAWDPNTDWMDALLIGKAAAESLTDDSFQLVIQRCDRSRCKRDCKEMPAEAATAGTPVANLP